MKNFVCLAVCFSFLLLLPVDAAEVRTWSTADGKFKIEAEFVNISADGKTVSIRRKDGEERKVPLDRLSKADQEFVNQQKATGVPKAEEKPIDDSVFKVTKDNFIRYDDDGTVTIRSKTGTERSSNIRALSTSDMNCILEMEIKGIVSDKFFPPEQIKEQIEAYFKANPIKPEEKTEWVGDERVEEIKKRNKEKEAEYQEKVKEHEKQEAESKRRQEASEKRKQALFDKWLAAKTSKQREQIEKQQKQEEAKGSQEFDKRMKIKYPDRPQKESEYLPKKEVKRIIDRSLTDYEKNGVILVLLKLQEAIDGKYDKSVFNYLMQAIKNQKTSYSGREGIDAYVVAAECLDRAYRSKAGTNAELTLMGSDIRDEMRIRGTMSSEIHALRTSQELSRLKADREKEDARKQKTLAILPYCNKFSAFKHTEEESKRLKKLEEENRKKEFDQKSKDLFK